MTLDSVRSFLQLMNFQNEHKQRASAQIRFTQRNLYRI